MKNNWKRILPVLMIIAVICSLVWYLFIYDRDFTRDVLLQQARYFEDQGNHSVATWLYDLAYHQSGDNEDVAIELAEQYKANGNYTKAEYTLSNAIADTGGSVKLYMALCQTYVEQDMLLDAVSMLDKIADPSIKAQLDAMRPKPATADFESGYYSKYISISLSAESGKIYAATGKDYPSVQDAPYSEAIPLASGENIIYAIVLGENGLVSTPSIFNYTIGGVIEEVTFIDASMEAAVRQLLGKANDEKLYTNDLWTVTSFDIPQDAMEYDDLRWFTYLQTLTIRNGSAASLEKLASLSHLNTLTVEDTYLSDKDVSVIAALPSLKNLTMTNCQLSSIESLSGAKLLVKLDLTNNAIRDISSLSFMSHLKELYLGHNALTNLSFISALSGLEVLDVSYNSLISMLPLAGCPSLKDLDISHNNVASLNGMENLRNLVYFYATYNEITDASLLAGCPNLIELDISNNAITDISMLSNLVKMTFFNFSNNKATSIPELNKSCALAYINGSNNQLTSVDALSGLSNLNSVYVDHNKITTLDPLAQCLQLVRVDAFGNPISNVSALTEMSIVVHYDPT